MFLKIPRMIMYNNENLTPHVNGKTHLLLYLLVALGDFLGNGDGGDHFVHQILIGNFMKRKLNIEN